MSNINLNTLGSTISQDLRALKWWLLLWVSLLSFNHWIQLKYLTIEIGPTLPLNVATSVTVFMTSLIILGRMVFHHPATGISAAWRTRPVIGWQVGFAKLILGGLFLILIPSLFSISILSGGFQWSIEDLLSKLMYMGSHQALLVIFFLLVASLGRNGSEFVLSLLGICLAILVAGISTISLSLNTHLFDYSPEISRGVWLVCIGWMVALFILQYHRPNRLKHLCWLGGLLLVIGSAEYLSSSLHGGLARLSSTDTKLTIYSVDPLEQHDHPELKIGFENLDPNHVWQLTGVFAPPNHARVKMTNFDQRTTWIKSLAINDQLGLAGYTIDGPTDFPQTFHLHHLKTRNHAETSRDNLSELSRITARLERVRLTPLGRLPITEHASLSNRRITARLQDVSTNDSPPHITLGMAISHSPSATGRDPLFVFIDHYNKHASIVRRSRESTSSARMAGLVGNYTLEFPRDWSLNPKHQVELLIVEMSPEGYVLLSDDSPKN